MKTLYIIFLALVIAGALVYGGFIDNPILNKDFMSNRVIIKADMDSPSAYYDYNLCDGRLFKDMGLPNTQQYCDNSIYCQLNNPDGTSYLLANDLKCCVYSGTCGVYV